MKKAIFIFWRLCYYVSLSIFLFSIIIPFTDLLRPQLHLLAKQFAFSGLLLLFVMLSFKNIVRLLPDKFQVSHIKEHIKYQREQGLTAVFLLFSHGVLQISFALSDTQLLFYQIVTIAGFSGFLIYMVCTSYPKIQKKIPKWKQLHSMIWLFLPIVYLHILLMTKDIEKYVYMGIFLLVPISIGLVNKKSRRRSIRQFIFIGLGILLLFIFLYYSLKFKK